MNKSDLPRIAKTAAAAIKLLDKHGQALFTATHDWQSPLRSGGAAGCKGDHADPTPQQVIKPDPLTLEHAALVADLEAFQTAALNLGARLQRLAPIDPTKIDRGRQNTVPACIVCAGPAVPVRRGMCDACRKAWERADHPDVSAFRKQRLRDLIARKTA